MNELAIVMAVIDSICKLATAIGVCVIASKIKNN